MHRAVYQLGYRSEYSVEQITVRALKGPPEPCLLHTHTHTHVVFLSSTSTEFASLESD